MSREHRYRDANSELRKYQPTNDNKAVEPLPMNNCCMLGSRNANLDPNTVGESRASTGIMYYVHPLHVKMQHDYATHHPPASHVGRVSKVIYTPRFKINHWSALLPEKRVLVTNMCEERR